MRLLPRAQTVLAPREINLIMALVLASPSSSLLLLLLPPPLKLKPLHYVGQVSLG